MNRFVIFPKADNIHQMTFSSQTFRISPDPGVPGIVGINDHGDSHGGIIAD
ncbi:MAG: hypothetical protein UV09_C0022G0005 [Candidatus Gottesmanbacteria bacterium GW2011_GWA2_42_18]|uniref:Uncharacterized protein n=1 Tax=Candidatus Gottesmanbacteria bacterium GW2011_GWA2_42_18 TaxID=1618442 RepID=A0A0G1C937_9BACT|nr:MAG: hypothetical protein UV09_C0022G0005 [Candidatus Gottesmanbacteria bacterium GW2011_GWA2_42_18]KKS74969.1 MAG: hypothetical protein UV46_C0029G0009 [Candidatus Gottesmanbacteria bacterium GW2011_GWC2_42_8]